MSRKLVVSIALTCVAFGLWGCTGSNNDFQLAATNAQPVLDLNNRVPAASLSEEVHAALLGAIPGDLCEQLRHSLLFQGTTTPGNTTHPLLPGLYQEQGLLGAKARLVLRTPMPWASVGLCNVRSMVLDYLVLAALVGADVVLPEVPSLSIPRSGRRGIDQTPQERLSTQLEGFFDVQHLRNEWKRFCPSMRLFHDSAREGSSGPYLADVAGEVVRQQEASKVRLGSTRSDLKHTAAASPLRRVHEMDVGIRGFLTSPAKRAIVGRGPHGVPAAAVVVNVKKWHLWDWALPHSGAFSLELRLLVGASLRSPPYVMTAAREAIDHLNSIGNGRGFCAAHLRVEADMRHMGAQANATLLSEAFLKAAAAAEVDGRGVHSCSVLYVAAGTAPDLQRLSDLAVLQGIHVVSRSSLLAGNRTPLPLFAASTSWTYAQTAVLEYEILAASWKFFGAAVSSFSWNLAVRRNLFGAASAGAASFGSDPRVNSAWASLDAAARPKNVPAPFRDNFSELFLGSSDSEELLEVNHQGRAIAGMWP